MLPPPGMRRAPSAPLAGIAPAAAAPAAAIMKARLFHRCSTPISIKVPHERARRLGAGAWVTPYDLPLYFYYSLCFVEK